MPKLPPGLMEKLQNKLGLTVPGVYARISSISNKYKIRTRPAAIKLAMDSGIGYKRFVTDEDLQAIRGLPSDRAAPSSSAAESDRPLTVPRSKNARRKLPVAQRKQRGSSSRPSQFNLFISHIHEEAELAGVLRGWFHAAFPGMVTAFVSSDYEDNPLGARWLEEIDGAMEQSRMVISLLSPMSMERMWIHMETGWALGRRIEILPICHSGARVDRLPRPYADYGATDVERSDFARRLLMALKQRLGLSHQLPDGMLAGLRDDVRVACAKLKKAT